MNQKESSQKWVIGVSGSSGMPYALRLIEVMAQQGHDLHVVFSEAALRVLHEELDIKLSQSFLKSENLFDQSYKNICFYNPKDIGAWFASGSATCQGMVIVPCSMASLGMIANGCGFNLLHRAADVCLKEHRRLVIVPRETPLSEIHLENMLKLSRMGARIVAAMPGFYHKPTTLSELVDMMVMKILDSMGIENNVSTRWRQINDEDVPDSPSTVIPLRLGGIK